MTPDELVGRILSLTERTVSLRDEETGAIITAPTEIWVGTILQALHPDERNDIIGNVAIKLKQLQEAKQPRIVTQ